MFIVTGFTDNNICFLGEMMNRICNFTELDLSANYISNDGIIHFLNNINVATEIRLLNLCGIYYYILILFFRQLYYRNRSFTNNNRYTKSLSKVFRIDIIRKCH